VADLGITGADLVPEEGKRVTVRLRHAASKRPVSLDWRQESFGTRSWFALLGPLLLALDEGAVLLVDELDASLHPRFAAEIIRLLQDPEANPKAAQLVFTSHDATVLSTPSGGRLLQPEQVWLTEKDEDGASDLYSLTAAGPGEHEDLASSYLAGVFGAVPNVLEGALYRSLLVDKARREDEVKQG
jgi:AAA15 family ATPase/GTPase